jgi:hypothetical protein
VIQDGIPPPSLEGGWIAAQAVMLEGSRSEKQVTATSEPHSSQLLPANRTLADCYYQRTALKQLLPANHIQANYIQANKIQAARTQTQANRAQGVLLRNRQNRFRVTRTLARQRSLNHEVILHDSAFANGELIGGAIDAVRKNRFNLRRIVHQIKVGAAVTRVAAALTLKWCCEWRIPRSIFRTRNNLTGH